MDWVKLLTDLPITGVVIGVVVLFLRFLKERETANADILGKVAGDFKSALTEHGDRSRAAQEDLAKRYETGREKTIECLDRNTEALGKISGILSVGERKANVSRRDPV